MGLLSQIPLFRRFQVNEHKGLESLETSLKYRFKNKNLLEIALTHCSVLSKSESNYERMEFLGDAVIDEILSAWLYEKYPDAGEGFLTKRRSALVNRGFLFKMASHLNLMKFIVTDPSVAISDKKVAQKIASDVYESIVGAIYLDGGFKAVKNFIHRTLIANEFEAEFNSNHKGNLIESCHRRGLETPIFSVETIVGPEHRKTFTVIVNIGMDMQFSGSANSKKEAEQIAAKFALDSLSESS
ncbi:MAG: ribonuclease III [FCB group bacterium]|nr:ribonuclease III [FCB group bacterium]